MKALCWKGTKNVSVDTVPDPVLEDPNDIIVKVTLTAICGSDLHLYDGFMPEMEKGDILGHEFMGIVVEKGKNIQRLQIGDRVVIPFNIACGSCFFCSQKLYSCCDTTNRDAKKAEKMWGFAPAGLFGYSHLLGGYSGGQAEYVRVPYADIGALKIPEGVSDEKVLFLSDILPTGFMAAENCNIRPEDTVAVWGCGPVGQFCIASAFLLGAERVIAIDDVPERLALAYNKSGAEVLNFDEEEIYERLKDMTNGRGPDSCIDAVGLEAHGMTLDSIVDQAKTALFLGTDRPHALRQAIRCCRKGGTVSIPGVYGGFLDKFPLGQAHAKGLTFKMGQTHTHRYMAPLLKKIVESKFDPSFVISHRLSLDEAAHGYEMFQKHKDGCTKIVMTP